MPGLVSVPSISSPAARGGADQWLSLADVRRQLGGVGMTTIYRLLQRDPSFPRPVKVFQANKWSAKELAAWMEAQLAARDAEAAR